MEEESPFRVFAATPRKARLEQGWSYSFKKVSATNPELYYTVRNYFDKHRKNEIFRRHRNVPASDDKYYRGDFSQNDPYKEKHWDNRFHEGVGNHNHRLTAGLREYFDRPRKKRLDTTSAAIEDERELPFMYRECVLRPREGRAIPGASIKVAQTARHITKTAPVTVRASQPILRNGIQTARHPVPHATDFVYTPSLSLDGYSPYAQAEKHFKKLQNRKKVCLLSHNTFQASQLE